ncbi:MAG: SMC-Scp complex subunit ScpB [Candidatus Lindowbacteria bacterium RIFCSPLOWO2_12_FULL_62_27]|nr:MAG: SMC-Scp complex subunit ScpB [Candidatus Lindowbacteria bacterium RIFCSPLOWO2_12_FULL_62_27]
MPSLIESCLFVSDTPVTDRRMAEVLSRPVSEVRAGIQELRTLYAARGSALEVVEIAEGYRLATRPELEQTLAKLFGIRRIQRLSRAALEVLSIIAYRHRAKDPATAQDVEHIRGVDSYAVLKGLMEQDFIRIAGRKEVPGAPHLYVTTTRFQEYFGLKDLTDMPDETELDALFKESVQPVIETAPAGSAPRISASGASSVGVSDSDPAPQVPASPTPAPPEPPSHEPSPAPGS